MLPKQWIRSPYHLLWTFLSIALVLTATLGWLGWQLLQQDRALAKQRAQERVEVAADLVTAALQRDLSELEQDLTHLANMSGDGLARGAVEFSRRLPGNAVLLLISTDGVESLPARAAGCNILPGGRCCSHGAVRRIAWRRWPPALTFWNRPGYRRSG